MGKKKMTLRTMFLTRVLLVWVLIALLSAIVHLYLINRQISSQLEEQSTIISGSVKREITETELAARSLEHQIDLKLYSYGKLISQTFKDKSLEEITQGDLEAIQTELKLAGLTLFARQGNDIVGIKATDKKEVGFSTREFGYYEHLDHLFKGEEVKLHSLTFKERDAVILPIAQSGSHEGQPAFFKYAYYHAPNAPYIISLYIEANEVHKLLNNVGPNAIINNIKKEHGYLEEIAVLNPKVFINPSLEKQLYPSMGKVVYGTFKYKSEKDIRILKEMNHSPYKKAYIEKREEERVYKLFLPLDQEKVMFMALNYNKLIEPLIYHSILISVTGFMFLFVLYMVISRFFKRIHSNIDQMVNKVKRIAQGDYGLTVISGEQYEFKELTDSINHMSSRLQQSFETLMNEVWFRKQILSSIPLGIITVDDQNEEIEINEKAIELTQLSKKEILDIWRGNVPNDINKEFWNSFSSKQLFHTKKISLQRQDGMYTALVSQSPFVNEKQQVMGRIFYFLDISEMEKLEKRVHRMEKLAMVGEISAGAAHEIKNPLTVIHGFMTLMDKELGSSERERFHLPLMLGEVERIDRLVKDMLLLAKPSVQNHTSVSLPKITEEILPLIQANCPPGVEVQVDLDDVFINVNQDQIKQVFLNLVMNSIEAISGHGKVQVFSRLSKNTVHIFIQDDGPGIPEEIQSQIFEPFISGKQTGTGLGLTITQRIVESYDGELQLVSSGPSGTIFEMIFPVENDRIHCYT